MARFATRVQAIEVAVAFALVALIGRAAQVQLIQGARWSNEARVQRTERITLGARRGALLDRHGTELARTQETYHVGIAPNELRDRARDAALIARELHLSASDLEEALRKRYAYFAGPFTASEIAPLRATRGVHLVPLMNRFYPRPELARPIIGRVGDDGRGASGLELELDSLLAGTAGAAVVLKDRAGHEFESPARIIAEPLAGADVVLTLDAELQDIAQRALDDAVLHTQADGGDVVMLDPASGEVLALAACRRDRAIRPSAFTETYEPGSIAKIFAAAALLSEQLVSPSERVSGEAGRYRLGARTITDEEPLASLTLADAIRVSSNIGIVKFAARLSPDAQYTMLRNFGLGSLTGIEFPAEAAGRLRPPANWSGVSAASLAMGYEVSVTPIQIAAAYGALANDGVLLAPTLIREIRAADGRVMYRHQPEPVRRVVTPAVASALRQLLVAVVEHGTGAEAALAHYTIAAKTGTARRVVRGRYAPGQYTASFAAVFPADHPQVVLVVKLDDPRNGSYFAAQTAAPVTRSMLEQALAARDVGLDRARLSTAATLPNASLAEQEVARGVVPYVVPWPYRPDTVPLSSRASVPDVRGRDLRAAVRVLHARGFRVVLRGSLALEPGQTGVIADRTMPAAGEMLEIGSAVTLFTR
ncbi:MAG TPA: penicillin-binding transpeptidase domain-containing protein [Gemmatimonadales bacterium]|nr:penicillin-binding transpeptidase domain-containing protein [Gemmatimonadales bacterium]